MTAPDTLLHLDQVTIQFGGLKAVADLDLAIARGEMMGLIGPNGAGKTTVFNLITGVYAPTRGRILLDGRPIGGLRPSVIARRGITRTFQNIRLFSSRSCRDNVCIAAHQHVQSSLADAVFATGRFERDEKRMKDEADQLLETLGLSAWADTLAAELPYGQQRRLEIARALAGRPKLLLLDEPAAGLNHEELGDLSRLIRDARDRLGITVLLVEHHMSLVMSVSDHIVALNFGRKIAEGTPEHIQKHPDVIEAYLGAPADV
jgi:branched-chain amino acid transport system ATP-binding protein